MQKKKNHKTIGISYWGFCEKFDNCVTEKTPDGHRYGRPAFIDELTNRGHKVVALQNRREFVPYSNLSYCDHLTDLDLLFIEWRWPTYKNSDPTDPTEPDLKRQKELLEYYHGKIPIIIWDTDLKITEEDEKKWNKVIIADPSYEPRK